MIIPMADVREDNILPMNRYMLPDAEILPSFVALSEDSSCIFSLC
jgi:hypothetical protein